MQHSTWSSSRWLPFALAAACVVTQAWSTPAHARNLSEMLGELRWGSSRQEVLEHWTRTIRNRYQEQMNLTSSPMKQDHLRDAMRIDLQKLQRGYVAFNGQGTGWDVSFLRDEFAHNNHESVFVFKDKNNQHFYFFRNDRLWKCYSALDSSLAANQPYHVFVRQLRTQHGKGVIRQGKVRQGGDARRWVEWQDGRNRLRAMDETEFYGFYGLVLEDVAASSRIEQARRASAKPEPSGHPLVDLVISHNEDNPREDLHADIADRITGKTRQR